MRKLSVGLGSALLLLAAARPASAHCQVPCGIYGDKARVKMMLEDARTIAKAMKLIRQLSKRKDARSRNQLVRWVNTKEHHAARVMRTVAQYFMAQKIKLPASGDRKARKAYLEKLSRHHAVMVAAMVCKQNVDPAKAKALKTAIEGLARYWP